MDFRRLCSSVLGISQAKILERVSLSSRVFLIEGSNPRLLHWQVNSLPLSHLGSRTLMLHVYQIQHLPVTYLSGDGAV